MSDARPPQHKRPPRHTPGIYWVRLETARPGKDWQPAEYQSDGVWALFGITLSELNGSISDDPRVVEVGPELAPYEPGVSRSDPEADLMMAASRMLGYLRIRHPDSKARDTLAGMLHNLGEDIRAGKQPSYHDPSADARPAEWPDNAADDLSVPRMAHPVKPRPKAGTGGLYEDDVTLHKTVARLRDLELLVADLAANVAIALGHVPGTTPATEELRLIMKAGLNAAFGKELGTTDRQQLDGVGRLSRPPLGPGF